MDNRMPRHFYWRLEHELCLSALESEKLRKMLKSTCIQVSSYRKPVVTDMYFEALCYKLWRQKRQKLLQKDWMRTTYKKRSRGTQISTSWLKRVRETHHTGWQISSNILALQKMKNAVRKSCRTKVCIAYSRTRQKRRAYYRVTKFSTKSYCKSLCMNLIRLDAVITGIVDSFKSSGQESDTLLATSAVQKGSVIQSLKIFKWSYSTSFRYPGSRHYIICIHSVALKN